MAYGDSLGYNYEIPRNEQPQQVVSRGGQAPEFEAGLPEIGDISGIEQVSGMTQEFYQKYAALKSFAHKMYSDHGIDITKPDVNDEYSIRAHDLYMKAVADVYNTYNALKNSQKARETTFTKSLENPNVQYQGTYGQGVFDENQAINRSETDRVEGIVKNAEIMNDRGLTAEANALINKGVSTLRTELKNLIEQDAPDRLITQKLEELKQLESRKALYDPTKDKELAQRERLSKDDEKPARLVEFMNRITKGDLSLLKGHNDYNFKLSSRGDGIIVFDKKGKPTGDKLMFGTEDFHERLGGYINTHPQYTDFYSKDRYEDELAAGERPVQPNPKKGFNAGLVAFGDNLMKGDKEVLGIVRNAIKNQTIDIDLPEEVGVRYEKEGRFINDISVEDGKVILSIYTGVNEDNGSIIGPDTIEFNVKDQDDRDALRRVLMYNSDRLPIPGLDDYIEQGQAKQKAQWNPEQQTDDLLKASGMKSAGAFDDL